MDLDVISISNLQHSHKEVFIFIEVLIVSIDCIYV